MAHFDKSKEVLDLNLHPAKIDLVRDCHIIHPDVTADWIVKDEDISGGGTIACTVDIPNCDFPRNLLVTQTDNAAADLATVTTVTGLDQFGTAISETFTIAAGSTTATGSKVFSYVTAVSVVCTDAAAGDLLDVGFDIAETTAKFGLPIMVGAYTDVKSIIWDDAGTVKNVTVASGNVDTTYQAVLPKPTGGLAAADSFYIRYKPSLEGKIQREEANTAFD